MAKSKTESNTETETRDDQPIKSVDDQNVNASPVDLDTISDELASSMPDVQDHAINQHEEKERNIRAEYADLRDTDGNPFDPSIHKTNAQGEPTTTKLGKLVKKPGRKSIKGASVVSSAAPINDDHNKKMAARASGMAAAHLLMQVGIVVGGEEWHPREDKETGLNEKRMLEGAFGDYFEAAGLTDIPPGWALTIAIGGYMLPRFTMPKTQSRAKKFGAGLKRWWINRKLRKHGVQLAPDEKPEKSDKLAA